MNNLALSVTMTWLYQRSRHDVLFIILVHVAANYCGGIGIPFHASVREEVACVTLIMACRGLR